MGNFCSRFPEAYLDLFAIVARLGCILGLGHHKNIGAYYFRRALSFFSVQQEHLVLLGHYELIAHCGRHLERKKNGKITALTFFSEQLFSEALRIWFSGVL